MIFALSDIALLPELLVFCNWLYSDMTDATMQVVFSWRFTTRRDPAHGQRTTLRLPDQSDAGGGRRKMEPARDPRHDVRQPPPFSRIADQIRGRHLVKYPRRHTQDIARSGGHLLGRCPQPQAEGNLLA